jgi:hypothetical protein
METIQFVLGWYGWASPVGLGVLLAGVGVLFWGQQFSKRKQ